MGKNPQKVLKGRYLVVPRSIILLIDGDKVLLQKAAENKKIFPGYYNGIGGHIERCEDVLAGATRELKEETGVTCDDLRLAGSIMIDVEKDTGILLFVFTGSKTIGRMMPSEEGTLHWMKIDSLKQMKVVDDIPELVARVLDFKTSGKMFFGKYIYNEEGERTTSWAFS